MKGAIVSFDDTKNYIDLTLTPGEFDGEMDSDALIEEITAGEFNHLYISKSSVKSACEKANHHYKTSDHSTITERIGERRHAEIEFRVPEDQMSAQLILTAPYGGQLPNVPSVLKLAQKNNIVRGIGVKRIKRLIQKAKKAEPGQLVEDVIAKGLPPRDGYSSRFKPLVPNALERVLKPQTGDNDRVDMRNLGEVICVKANTEVLRRLPPSKGRSGFDVRGAKIPAKEGDWIPFKMGRGTAVHDKDANLLVSTVAGMPKYLDLTMNVDDTFICSGVNVGTGHVNYDGAVLVNGDVTEKMVIRASGDVTINGFVESAQIEAGGDIIITEGALGKVNENATEYSCRLHAAGSIHVQHGQGIDLFCMGNVTVGRQLAYSKVHCAGDVIVGQVDRPQGNIFACEVVCQGQLAAGTLGAVSGSTLKIDFSLGYNALMEKRENLDELMTVLKQNNLRHKEKLDYIESKYVPKDLQDKLSEAQELLKNEDALLNWIESKAMDLKEAKDAYLDNAKLIATKRMYAGVSVKLNNRAWRSEREYDRSTVVYEGHQWQYEPLVNV